jgi:hypothetical protein
MAALDAPYIAPFGSLAAAPGVEEGEFLFAPGRCDRRSADWRTAASPARDAERPGANFWLK